MSATLRTQFALTVLSGGAPSTGSLPARIESVDTTSRLIHQTTQLIGTSYEVVAAGDVTDNVVCVLRNTHPTATVSVGVEVAAVFYPLFAIPPGTTAYLPRLTAIAATFLQSTAATTDVLVSLYKIV